MDPYKVLGLSPGASDDEIKKAYRTLAKRYHPDANPGDKTAEQKMKEINAAYDMLINHKYDPASGTSTASSGGASYSDPFGGYNPFGGSYRTYGPFGFGGFYENADASEPPAYRSVRVYLQSGRYQEALRALGNIAENERTARWYYYAAQAHAGLGNRVAALENARRAVSMEPSNPLYQNLLSRLQNPGRTYTTYGRGFSAPSGAGTWCLSVCAINLLLRLCCFPGSGGVICC